MYDSGCIKPRAAPPQGDGEPRGMGTAGLAGEEDVFSHPFTTAIQRARWRAASNPPIAITPSDVGSGTGASAMLSTKNWFSGAKFEL